MARPGRKRSLLLREPNGQTHRRLRPVSSPIPPEVLLRRAEAVGACHALDARAGSVLGRLWLTGRVSERQYQAGSRLGAVWRHWARLADSPWRHAKVRHATVTGGIDYSPDEAVEQQEWLRLDGAMTRARGAVAQVGRPALAWALIESVAVDDLMPPRLETDRWVLGWTALREGLDSLADLYGLPANSRR